MGRRDPIARAADESRDLYDVATWEPRSLFDRLVVRLYGVLHRGSRAAVVLLALAILGSQLAFGGLLVWGRNPEVGAYVLLSILPALVLAVYVWRADVTAGEPLRLLVVTFLLGFLFAGFAAVLNSLFGLAFEIVGVPLVVFFFLVVGPVEEAVKLLAVRLHAYRSSEFDAVVDGAVYGAMAGLGFATIENGVYITNQFLIASEAGADGVLARTLETAAVRLFAGPGHVIYSAFAGYYLGLAKFNREHRGPLVVKGLLVAVLLHATYNSVVTNLDAIQAAVPSLGGVSDATLFVGFVVVYDAVFGYGLYRKLARYRRAYVDVEGVEAEAGPVERTEFDPPTAAGPIGPTDVDTASGDGECSADRSEFEWDG